jgi:hypothetical protein
MLDAALAAEPADRQQTINSLVDGDEGTERSESGDGTGQGRPLAVERADFLLPGIGEGVAQTEGETLLLPVAAFYRQLELLTDLQHLLHRTDSPPGDFGNR